MAGFFFVHGTWGGLVLRVVQCAHALASIITMSKAIDPIPEDAPSANFFLESMMMFHATWNFIQVGSHLYFAWRREKLQSPSFAWLFIFIDAVVAFMSLAAASSSTYVTLLFLRDTGLCRVGGLPCGQFLLAASFASVAAILQVTTACTSFCQLVKLVTQPQADQ